MRPGKLPVAWQNGLFVVEIFQMIRQPTWLFDPNHCFLRERLFDLLSHMLGLWPERCCPGVFDLQPWLKRFLPNCNKYIVRMNELSHDEIAIRMIRMGELSHVAFWGSGAKTGKNM